MISQEEIINTVKSYDNVTVHFTKDNIFMSVEGLVHTICVDFIVIVYGTRQFILIEIKDIEELEVM